MQLPQAHRTPVLICIDIEPQQRAVDLRVRQDWFGFPETWEFMDHLRARLARATQAPVRFNWFLRMDPQVSEAYGSADWAVTRYRNIFDKILLAQDELGLHPHAWRLDHKTREWYVDFADQRWVEECVTQSFEQFTSTFSKPCRSFRFGDRWLNNRTIDLIERLGARFDLTIEPGRKSEKLRERFTGSLPDYTSAPRTPYQPSNGNYLQPGKEGSTRNLCMIPVSTVDPQRAFRGLAEPSHSATSEADRGRSRRYEGYLDLIDHRMLFGWAYDSSHPDEAVSVDVYDNHRLVGRCAAEMFRHDLLLEGKGSGAHAFFIPLPTEWRDGRLHQVSIRAAASDFELFNSPQELRLEEQTAVDHWTMNLSENSALFAKGLDALLVDERVPHLNLVVRTDAIARPSGRAYLNQNFEWLISHPLAGSLSFTTPGEAICGLKTHSS